MTQGLGINAVLTLLSHFVFIMISFRIMTAVRFDRFLRPNHVWESQVLLIFVAITIGYNVSEFFLSLMTSALNLPYLIK